MYMKTQQNTTKCLYIFRGPVYKVISCDWTALCMFEHNNNNSVLDNLCFSRILN